MVGFIGRLRRLAAVLAGVAMLGVVASARAEGPNDGLPIPDLPQHDLTAIDRMFRPPPPPPVSLFPRMREEMTDAPAVVRDSKVVDQPAQLLPRPRHGHGHRHDHQRSLGGRRLDRLRDRPPVRCRVGRHCRLRHLPALCAARPRQHRPAAARPGRLCGGRPALWPRPPVREHLLHRRPLSLRHALSRAAGQPHDPQHVLRLCPDRCVRRYRARLVLALRRRLYRHDEAPRTRPPSSRCRGRPAPTSTTAWASPAAA